MELDIKPKIYDGHSRNVVNDTSGVIPMNLYRAAPHGQLTIEECEDLFRQRLEALTIMDKAEALERDSLLTSSLREIKSYVYKTNCIVLRANDREQYRQDHFSHMLTRMFCVHQPNLWDWFKSREKKLFSYRLRDQAMSLSGDKLAVMLKNFNFKESERVVGQEFSELVREKLIGWKTNDFRNTGDIFKVKFTHALKFVSRRSVSLRDGYAFLAKMDMISVICDVFERHLESELHFARQHFNPQYLQTPYLIKSMELVYDDHKEKKEEENRKNRVNNDGESNNPFRINLDIIDELASVHFPPCMRHVHEALRQDHHLKHQARMHYGAFLRAGCVDMDSAIEFWRAEFTKKIANDKFERQYKYNIRHLYGREGHKKALSCFSCDKIINDNPPGVGEKHGCPFKQFDETHLRAMLGKHGLREVDIDSIIQHKNDKDYKLACTHYFGFSKGALPSEPIKYPIGYYYESMRLATRPPPEPLPEVAEGNLKQVAIGGNYDDDIEFDD